MSDSSDDMEFYSGECEEDEDIEVDIINLQKQVEGLSKIIYGLNIKVKNLEKKVRILEIDQGF